MKGTVLITTVQIARETHTSKGVLTRLLSNIGKSIRIIWKVGEVMMDRKKVMSWLEGLAEDDWRSYHSDSEVSNIAKSALALLKEQDGKQGEKPMIENETGWNCPSCGMNLIGKTASGYPCDLIDLPEDEPIHFCPKCGQAVKWE